MERILLGIFIFGLCLIPLVVAFLLARSLVGVVKEISLKEVYDGAVGLILLLAIFFVLGLMTGVIPLSIFGIENPTINLDENGQPDCTPDYMGGCI